MPIDLPTELIDLRRSILTMGAAVEHRVRLAMDALIERDIEAANAVRRGDDEIDEMEVEIEQECLRILALTQPVAGDLRFVLAVMRINSELERIADLARSIAKRTLDLDRLTPIDMPEGLTRMAREAHRMFSDALSALTAEEAAMAQRVREADDRVDDLQKEIFAWAQEEIPRHVEWTKAVIDVMSITRKLERIADLSSNMAEEVIFLVEGTLVRHAKL
jgi:phosphate transport system protein